MNPRALRQLFVPVFRRTVRELAISILRPRLPSLRPLAGAPRQALLLSSWLRPASSTTTFIAHGGTGGSSRPSSSMNTNAAS